MTQPEASSTISRTFERSVIFLTAMGHILCHLGMTIFGGVFLAIADEHGLAPQSVTALALLGVILMGVGAIPVGLWVDEKGPTRVLWIYYCSMTIAAVTIVTTTGVLHLFIGFTLLGLAASIYHPVGLAMLSIYTTNRGRAMGINGIAGNLGIAAGPALGYYTAKMGTWKLAYGILAGLSLVSLLIMQWIVHRYSLDAHIAQKNVDDSALPPEAQLGTRRWKRALPVFLLLCAMTCGGLNYRSLVTSLPVFVGGEVKADMTKKIEKATTEKKQSGDFTSLKVFVILLLGSVGQWIGGWAVTRFGAKAYLFVIFGLSPLALALGFLEGHWLAVGVAGLFAIFLFAQQPIENCVLAEWTSQERRGVSYGTKFAMTFGIGALGLQAVGFVWGRYHRIAPVMFGIAVLGLVMIGLIFFALRTRRSLENERAPAQLVAQGEPT